MGIGKKRTKLGAWLDARGMTQTWLAKQTGMSHTQVSRLTSNTDYDPTLKTVRRVMAAVRTVDDRVEAKDLFDV